MLCDFFENAIIFLVILAFCGLLTIVIVSWLTHTESRLQARRILSCVHCDVVIVVSLAMLLIFVLQYIPPPVLGQWRVRFSNLVKQCAERPSEVSIEAEKVKDAMMLREFYHENFSDLLTIFSVLGTIFGIIVPLGAYFIQKRSIKDEAGILTNDVKARERELRRKQAAIAHELGGVRKELQDCRSQLSRTKVLRDLVSKNGFESMRSNLLCAENIYRVPNLSPEVKKKIVNSYFMQFVNFLCFAAELPDGGANISDVKRFSDVISMFRRDDKKLYVEVVRGLRISLSESPMPNVSGLYIAFGEDGCRILRKELQPVVPTLFRK